MAQRVQVTRVSDLDEAVEAAEIVKFSLDGDEYEIDLSAGEAARMRTELALFVRHARRVRVRRARPRRPSREDLPEIREYARERGHRISERGRVPGYIIAEYELVMASRRQQ